jgi:hypothetical protein
LNGEAVQDIQDWAYLSVTASGSDTGCTGTGCLYNYAITTTTAPTSSTGGATTTGGASGVIVDNISLVEGGAEQIYYNMLTATTLNAIQTSQSNP